MMDDQMMNGRIPEHHSRRFTVTTSRPTGQKVTTSDGMPVQTDDILKHVTYVCELKRQQRQWELTLQWVGLDNEGHRHVFPHEVIEKLLTHTDNIMKDSRKERARAGAATRRLKAEEAKEARLNEAGNA